LIKVLKYSSSVSSAWNLSDRILALGYYKI
jgi:hypothetical protein